MCNSKAKSNSHTNLELLGKLAWVRVHKEGIDDMGMVTGYLRRMERRGPHLA